MIKYEYITMFQELEIKEDEFLNEMGQDGWELCGVLKGEGGIFSRVEYYFKRVIPVDNKK